MNPFDLYGPEFLLFYVVFSCSVLLALYLMRRRKESGPLPNLPLQDPYLLACLNGGVRQVVRISALSLIDRGLLKVDSSGIATAVPGVNLENSAPAIEKHLLFYFRNPCDLSAVFDDKGSQLVAGSYEDILRTHRLIADSAIRSARRQLTALVIFILAAVSVIKIYIALGRGRHNIGILIVLTFVAAIAAAAVGNPRRTALGDQYFQTVKGLFSDLKGRIRSVRPGAGTRELLWTAALFGLAAVPTATFPFARYFRPAKSSSCSSGCGSSSCGSSGGDGGGGCGGGGCGGGCGGCGG